MTKVLVVEDNANLAFGLTRSLESEGYEVESAEDGVRGFEMARSTNPDLVVLDLMLPGMDGYTILKKLRAEGKDVPVLILTARGEEADKVFGFRLGADDYVTKPFSLRELVARIRAVSRRAGDGQPGSVDRDQSGPQTIGALELDRRTRRVRISGDEIALTAKEFDLLAFLANDVGAVHTRTEILESVWDAHWYGPTKTVDAHVASLRKKLGDHTWIESVRGVGFRLEPPA